MLILDLDDTIFETRSMNPKVFDSAISLIKNYYEKTDSKVKSEQIIADLWSLPIDVVFEKHDTPKALISEFYKRIAKVNYHELDIVAFDDYKELEAFDKKKILVTTGLKELQLAKIKALRIENDFDNIYIDDPRLIPRKHKIDIFRQILLDTKKDPREIWVIGDNPDSEIKAGKELGMNTIQRRSKSKNLSEYADYKIESFKELIRIIN